MKGVESQSLQFKERIPGGNKMLKRGFCLNNQYILMEKIGSGGGGDIYKAYHKNLKKYVVVKQIKDVAKGALDSRAEVDILKNLSNTYLPQVYDFLEIEGEVFTVIDYIDGESLDKVLKREKKIPQKTVLKWAMQLAEAMAYLHAKRPPIIHSDIKPANIMLRTNGDICLIDFNVSLAFDEEKRTSIGISEGYSPPEQYRSVEMYRTVTRSSIPDFKRSTEKVAPISQNAQERRTEYVSLGIESERSEKHQEKKDFTDNATLISAYIGKGVDERSDIYSLGATLYQLLTGLCPPSDFGKIVPIHKCKCNVSEGLTKIIEKMMAFCPDKRYRNGGEFLKALKNIRKIDSAYRGYIRKQMITGIGLVALYTAGIITIVVGLNLTNRERLNYYNQTIEQAEVRIEEGQFDEAQRLIEDAVNQIPTRIGAYEKEVFRLYASGNYEECIRYGRNTVNSPQYYVETDSDRNSLGNILYIMGNAYYEMEDYGNAVSCLESAISYCPRNSAFYCDLGIAYAKSGNRDKAEEILTQSESLGLAQDAIYLLRGELAFSSGRSEEAIELFMSALNLIDGESEQLRCVMLCAKAYDQMGNLYIDDEIAFLEQWKYSLGFLGELQIGEKLGEVYARNQEFDKALSEFINLKERGFVSYQIQQNIAVLYQQTDQFQLAEELLNEMAEQYPDRYETFKRLAFLEADIQQRRPNNERDYSQMRQYYEKALELCQGQEKTDVEMQQLEMMMQELAAGNWFD